MVHILGRKRPGPGSRGKATEKIIAATFEYYSAQKIARLGFMPVPMVCVGVTKNHRPIFTPKGKAPFDVFGYLMAPAHKLGIFIGAEIKSSVRKTSLPIVAPEKQGDGIQFHQLDSLAELAAAGGEARIIWDNAGEVGILKQDKINIVFSNYMEAMASEASNKDIKKGVKSISWEEFQIIGPVNMTGNASFIDWLDMNEL